MLQQFELTSAIACIYREAVTFALLIFSSFLFRRRVLNCLIFIFGAIFLVSVIFILFVILITIEAPVRVLSLPLLTFFCNSCFPEFVDFLFAGTFEVSLKVEDEVVVLLLLHFVVLQLLPGPPVFRVLQQCLVAPLCEHVERSLRACFSQDLFGGKVNVELVGIVPSCEKLALGHPVFTSLQFGGCA